MIRLVSELKGAALFLAQAPHRGALGNRSVGGAFCLQIQRRDKTGCFVRMS